MWPDLLILGDSHSRPLFEGAAALGLKVDGLTFSGSTWHDNSFTLDLKGFTPIRAPGAVRALKQLQDRVGVKDVFRAGTPVISTMGFHLGRLVPPFGWLGHRFDTRVEPDEMAVSSAFVKSYIEHHRSKHFRTMQLLRRKTKLVIIAPPIHPDRPQHLGFKKMIVSILQASKQQVYDPSMDFGVDGFTSPVHFGPDGIHGTVEYGRAVVHRLIDLGYLAFPPTPSVN